MHDLWGDGWGAGHARITSCDGTPLYSNVSISESTHVDSMLVCLPTAGYIITVSGYAWKSWENAWEVIDEKGVVRAHGTPNCVRRGATDEPIYGDYLMVCADGVTTTCELGQLGGDMNGASEFRRSDWAHGWLAGRGALVGTHAGARRHLRRLN